MASVMGTLRAVVFDFDGLLADTEAVHSRTWRGVLADCGIEISAAEYADHWIRRGRGIADFIAARSLSHDPAVLLERKTARYLGAIAGELAPMPGALTLLESLHGQVPLALVTSSRSAMVVPALARLGMLGRFDATVTWEMVQHPKPHPEPFLRAAALLDVQPPDCVAIEDAEKGVISAAEAGMTVVAVPNEHTRDHDFTRASLVAPSLSDLALETLERLSARR
jgi:HAD superfamily hydrolase (TIGR01509 family)